MKKTLCSIGALLAILILPSYATNNSDHILLIGGNSSVHLSDPNKDANANAMDDQNNDVLEDDLSTNDDSDQDELTDNADSDSDADSD